ncbi:MAG: methane/phenol/toluene hydroxylase [Conexibacter sp.]|nr:methane/phenol/toluene hydroxylase [Conexibacter sp.]
MSESTKKADARTGADRPDGIELTREQRDQERSFQWFKPERKKASMYEDVTLDTTHSLERHFRWGYQIHFADGRPTYWDASAVKSNTWWDFRDPGALWERNFYQTATNYYRECRSAVGVAHSNALFKQFSPEWVEFLRDHIHAVAQAEYGLVMPMANAVRPSRGDCQLNCISFQGCYKLRHAEALALYGMELDTALGDFPAERGTRSFMEHPAWQPARDFLERLDLVHDWVEVVVAANLVFEPLVGVLLRRELLMNAASEQGDVVSPVFGRTGQAEWDWGRAWTAAFVADLVEDPDFGPQNRDVIDGWLRTWTPAAEAAVTALGELFEQLPGADVAAGLARVREGFAELVEQSGLKASELEGAAR